MVVTLWKRVCSVCRRPWIWYPAQPKINGSNKCREIILQLVKYGRKSRGCELQNSANVFLLEEGRDREMERQKEAESFQETGRISSDWYLMGLVSMGILKFSSPLDYMYAYVYIFNILFL